MIKKGIPKRDGSGKGVAANRGRGKCKPIKRRGLKPIPLPKKVADSTRKSETEAKRKASAGVRRPVVKRKTNPRVARPIKLGRRRISGVRRRVK